LPAIALKLMKRSTKNKMNDDITSWPLEKIPTLKLSVAWEFSQSYAVTEFWEMDPNHTFLFDYAT